MKIYHIYATDFNDWNQGELAGFYITEKDLNKEKA